MTYDVIGSGGCFDDQVSPLNLDDIMYLAKLNPKCNFKFIGTEYTIGDLCSWRGSYDIPSLTYETGKKTGKQIYDQLFEQIQHKHTGWKGGEFFFTKEQAPYISLEGSSSDYMIIYYNRVGNLIELVTKIIPY